MKRKLGIVSECLVGVPSEEALPLIKNAGFDNFFSGRYTLEETAKIMNAAQKVGLFFESIHAPFMGVNNMWAKGDEHIEIFEGIKTSIESAGECGVPIVVVHLSSGWITPSISEAGLARYDFLVELAEKKGVTVAFENLRKTGNVAYFVDRYEENDHVGFCYDCGHEHCYSKNICWTDIFGEKIVYTHIHDNFGIKEWRQEKTDLHMMPFDGEIDYQKMIDKLDQKNYRGSLTLELNNSRHSDMSHEKFLAESYARMKRISDMSRA